ncbi:MAG: hypothetical protein Q9164_002371 [Protoblastenia rupestris]
MPPPSESFIRALRRDTTVYLCFTLLIAAFGPFQFGYHLAELNAPQAVITCEKESVDNATLHPNLPQCLSMNVDQFALVSSIFTLGGLVGALLAGPFCNEYGRLRTMRLMTISFVAGPLVESLATNVALLSIGRVISGIGAGAGVVVVPIYISEISPPKEKGLFGALTQIMINLGILTTQTLGYFLSKDSLWRIILAIAGFIGLLQLIGLAMVPESPKWLAENGHSQIAREILRKMRGDRVDLDEEVKAWNIDSSARDICMRDTRLKRLAHSTNSLSAEEESLLRSSEGDHPSNPKSGSHSIGILAALLHPTYRPAIIAVIAVMVAQQLTGINSIIMYSVHLLSALLPTSAALLSVGLSALNLIMTTLCAPLSDKVGRKTCILLSIAGMGISSILLAVGISRDNKVLGAAATLLFVASFAVGLGPVPFILSNELVGPEAVGATQSWALAANWIATFVVSQFFPMLNKAMGERGRVYYVFAAFAAVFGAFIAWWVPETKGKRGADEVWGRRTSRDRLE